MVPEGQQPPNAEQPEVVTRWAGNLLDLSPRNPLVHIPDSAVPLLTDADTLPGLAAAVAAGVPVTVRGADDLDDLDIPDGARSAFDLGSAHLRSGLEQENLAFAATDTAGIRTSFPDLRRRATLIREQTGAGSLYLTVGALRFPTESDSEAGERGGEGHLAPLFLLPITLEGRRYGAWSLQLETQGETHLNDTLTERLRRAYEFVPAALTEPTVEGDALDVPATFARLRHEITERGLPLEVVDEARIALLEYSTLEMWRDLREHWATFVDNPVVYHLVHTPHEQWDAPAVDTSGTELEAREGELALPLPTDGSQMRAVAHARDESSFVLDGPPGTGKSQTITNLIADALASGKRVLFVAEKEAALEVVARRLADSGLAPRCLDLRGRAKTLRDLRAHLSDALAHPASEREDDLSEAVDALRDSITALAAHPKAVREDPGSAPSVDVAARESAVEEYSRRVERLRELRRETLSDLPGGETVLLGEDVEALRESLASAEMGIRELVAEHIDAILTITPCLLMSPAMVARYLPARSGLFDVVVFDEASQIRVADAVGAMGRARAVVIVGDPKQMPPTNLYLPAEPAARGEQEESILLEAGRIGLPRLRLTSHYRSRREDLVAFSNERYYGGELATFPSPAAEGEAVSSLEFRRVDGMFAAGRRRPGINLIESNAVVDEVRALITADPSVSLGVIAFNDAQRDDILDKLESDDSPLEVREALRRESEPVFVKNLEHVQGDERDHIVFSLAYSLHDEARLASDFASLRDEGGERRLNVAITRARVRNVVFASFEPEALSAIEPLPLGLEHLRDYLVLARDGEGVALGSPAHPGGGLTGEIADRLRDRGLEVRENVGMSGFRVDLAVRAKGRGWCAFLLDTKAWAEEPTTADRDAIPSSVLTRQMGWAQATRLYRAEWERDAEAVLRRIEEIAGAAAESDLGTQPAGVVHRALDADDPTQVVAAQADAAERVVALFEGTRLRKPTLTRFTAAHANNRGEREVVDRIPSPDAVAEVAEQWRDVVATEGPVYVDRAASIIGHRFGWRRLPFDRRISIMAAIPTDMLRLRMGGREFVWGPQSEPEEYQLVRGQARADRKLHEIAPQERANAVRLVVAENGGRASEAALLRGVREIFGFGLFSTLMKGSLNDVLTHLVEAGELRREGVDYVAVRPESELASQPAHAG